jgi:hypothetical protein
MGAWKKIGYVSIGLSLLGAVSEHRRGASGSSPSEEAAAAVAAIAQVTGVGPAPDGSAGQPSAQPRSGLDSLGQ